MSNKYDRVLSHKDIIAMSQAARDKKILQDLRRSGALDDTFMGSVAHHADIQRKATSGDPAAMAVGAAVGAGLYGAKKVFSGLRNTLSKLKKPSSPSPIGGPTGGPSPSPTKKPSPKPSPLPSPTGKPSPKPSPPTSPTGGPTGGPSPIGGPPPKPSPPTSPTGGPTGGPSPAPSPSATGSSSPTKMRYGKIAKALGKATQYLGVQRAKMTSQLEQSSVGYEALRMRLNEAAKHVTKKDEKNKDKEEDENLEEEAPANSVGGGENIAGINPPAGGSKATDKKKKKKQHHKPEKKVSAKKLKGIAAGKTIAQLAKIHGVSVAHLRHQLAKGMRVEREHTANGAVARKIAMDHLMENPNYYSALKKVEKGKELRAKAIMKQRELAAAAKLKKKQKD